MIVRTPLAGPRRRPLVAPVLAKIGALLLAFSILGACRQETTTPIDLRETVPPALDPSPGEDPNAAARAQVQALAEAECEKDSTRAEGVVQFADPDTGEVVNEYRIDCETFEAITPDRPAAPATQD